MNRPLLAITPTAQAGEALEHLAAELGLTDRLHRGRDAHGRPTLCVDGRPLAYSRSHSGAFCAQALAPQGRVGVDLVNPETIPPAGLEGFFTAAEWRWLRDRPENHRASDLAKGWAAKEAVVKALGLGLAFGPEAIELEPANQEGLRIARIAGVPGTGWQLEFPAFPRLVVALAWAP